MRRFLVWSVRVFALVGVITAIALLFYIFSVPSIAEQQIRNALREMGLGETSVQVRSIGTNHLQITNLNLGEEAGLRIGAAGVDYDTTLLGSVTVKNIEIIGATLDLRSDGEGLDMGPLADIKTSKSTTSLASDGLPFDRISVRSSTIKLQWQGRRFALPIEATITHKEQGVCDVDATIWLLGTAVPIKGVMDFSAPDPAVSAVAQDTAAAGISFRLSISLGEHDLILAGLIGSQAVGTNITAAIEPKTEGNADKRVAVATFTHSSANGASLSVYVIASPQPLRLALAGYELDATAISARAQAVLDFEALRFNGSFDLAASELKLRMGEETYHWKSPAFQADFEGQAESEQFVIKALPSTHVKFEAMSATTKGDELPTMTASASHLNFAEAALRWPRGSDPATQPQLRLVLAMQKPAMQMRDHQVAAESIEPTLTATLTADGRIALRGKLNIKDASYRNTPATIELLGLTAPVPFSFNDESPLDPGPIEIQSLRYGEDLLPAVTGTMHITKGRLLADATWPWQKKNPVQLAADIDLNHLLAGVNAVTGNASVRWKDVVVEDEEAVARKIKAAQLFRISGRFDIEGDFTLAQGVVTPRIVFVASDAFFAAADLDLNLRGIETTLIINSFDPLTTLPNQRLSVARGNLGELRFTDVIANFRLDAIDAMVLELAAWRVGGRGRFWMHAAQFDPTNPVLETQVFIEDMSVSEWLQIVQDNKITGEGFLYGRLPIRIDRNRDPMLTFGEGFLYAKPGKGWIKLADRDVDRRQTYETIEQAIADLAKEAKRRLLEAVNDYEFDTLQFDFIRQNSTILCRVTTSGRGRVGEKQEVGRLVVNIDNFGALLSERILRNTGSLGALDDELERLFE